jgi:hypothetical protein
MHACYFDASLHFKHALAFQVRWCLGDWFSCRMMPSSEAELSLMTFSVLLIPAGVPEAGFCAAGRQGHSG